jgi:hypothetical protein
MNNFGICKDVVSDDSNFLDTGLDHIDLFGIEDCTDSIDVIENDDAPTDSDEEDDHLLEDILKNHEIYSAA